MASVTSLGLHQPIGLHYAIQEQLLPSEPSSSEYTWHNYSQDEGSLSRSDDELLVTSRCVIWSRGGVFRKCYKFDLEEETVTQALLTSFSSVGPLVKQGGKLDLSNERTDERSSAIVVFLKTQAHIYFLSGTSHVIHLPFEIESACAAPNGIILQRKLRVDNLAPASLKFPKVPPNSFVSSQPQPWSAASSQLSTFSIADLGAPRQMPLHNSTLKDMWEPPSLKNDSNWPRLFSLSDPMAEMGLVVAQPNKTEHRKARRSSTKLSSLDTSEEILHISGKGDFLHRDNGAPLVLALTWNRETSAYTVWKLSYISKHSHKTSKRRVTSGATSRRRSSFMPGSTTGATTPVMGTQQTFRESLAPSLPNLTNKKTRPEDANDKLVDFVSSLDPDYDGGSVPRRKSRRVSSMLARSDLSANHERSAFSELATGHTGARRTESLNYKHGRVSVGSYQAANGSNQPPAFNQSLNSYLEAPVDDLLDELRAGGDFEGFHNMGLDDEEFDALKQEIVLTKVGSVTADQNNIRYSSQHMPAKTQSKVFTLTAPPSAADEHSGNSIVICILDSDDQKLLVLTLTAQTHKIAGDIDPDSTITDRDEDITVVSLGSVMRAKGVIDACRLDDGLVSRILVLTQTPDGYGELSLQAPWSVLMKVPLPAKFTTNNMRNLGHDATPKARREGGFKRVLSQGPQSLTGLRNSKVRGLVDLVDDSGRMHQLQVLLEPRNPHVKRILEVCRCVVPGSNGGEGVLVAWWHVMQWFRLESIDAIDVEWSALVVTLFSMVLGFTNSARVAQKATHAKRKSRSGVLRSSSGAQADLENWEEMFRQETVTGNPIPSWADNSAWAWILEEESLVSRKSSSGPLAISGASDDDKPSFLLHHLKLAKDFASSTSGTGTIAGCLPCCGERPIESRRAALTDIVIGLHLLHEEHKLNTMSADSFSTDTCSLTPILGQMVTWLGWQTWVETYEVEQAALVDCKYDLGILLFAF